MALCAPCDRGRCTRWRQKQCPESFRLHFPCIPGALDEKICTGELFGADVKKDGNILPFHHLCTGHDVLRSMFECTAPLPQRPGTNLQLYSIYWSQNHPELAKPYNVSSKLLVASHVYTPAHGSPSLSRIAFSCFEPLRVRNRSSTTRTGIRSVCGAAR